MRNVAILLGCLTSIGCTTAAPKNQPLDAAQVPEISAGMQLASPHRSGRILLALTFSGGGTRASAFSYGVLQELAETQVKIEGESRPLLDEVDIISTVSGGSFTGAYYGLHGRKIFDNYEDVFLRKNVQGGLALEVLRPRYWLGLLRIDRSQLAARYYDRHIFHEATLGDLQRLDTPSIVINATDLSSAGRFPFSPSLFAFICSDFDRYPIADAVTASSAVPIVFRTVRLRNYGGQCGVEIPEWTQAEPSDSSLDLRSVIRAQIADQRESISEADYVHLLDGGLSDNLGLINGLAALSRFDHDANTLREYGHEDIELLLVITVNAETKTRRPWDYSDKPPTAVQVVNALSGAEMGARNKRAIQLARAGFGELAQQLSTPEKPVRFEMVEVSFDRVTDPDEQRRLSRIETSLTLSDQKIDRLIAAARQVLRESPELARAIEWLERSEEALQP
jgi:NTE family protein